jgi:tRNA-binding EMAP/Myf-like protein
MNPIAIRKREIREGVKSNGKVVSLRQGDDGADPNKPDAGKLAQLIAAYSA